MNIRTLNANEIECRVQTVNKNGCSVLLYKDARCDMRILDEIFGPLGWQRSHEVINDNLFCNVSIWDKEKQQWITKQDVGTESNAEKEKGQASDSFKRACFNLGIGRELYTAPFIWIKLGAEEVNENKGRYSPKVSFKVKEIGYNESREISKLIIVDNKGTVRYSLGNKEYRTVSKKINEQKIQNLYQLAESKGFTKTKVDKQVLNAYGKESKDLTEEEYQAVYSGFEQYVKG